MRLIELSTYLAAATSLIGAFTITSHLGYTSPTQKELIERNILDTDTLPIFASIGVLTRAIATLVTPLLIHLNISINALIVTHCLVGWAGWMLIITTDSASLLIIGIAMVGYYTGVAVIFIFTYIPEIALDSTRRVLSGIYGFFVRFGMFFTFFVGIWLSFRWLALVGMFQICSFCLFLQFVPTSPVELISRGLEVRARDTLLRLHGNDFNVEDELQKIKAAAVNKSISCWRGNLKSLTEWKVLKPLILMGFLGCFKEFGGHQSMIAYSSKILESQQAMDPKVAALFYPTFLICGAIVCISILNYCKLKWLMIFASALQSISHLSMAIYFLVIEKGTHCLRDHSYLCHFISLWPAFNISLFAFSFALGWGLVYYSMIGLMFSVHREISSAITNIFTSLSSCIVSFLFYYSLVYLGGFGTFLIFCIIQMVSIIFVYFCVTI